MPSLAMWNCKCGYKTPLPLHEVHGMLQSRSHSPMDAAFLNFVCPHCGCGARRLLQDIPKEEADSSSYRPVLFHAALRCVVEGCGASATVHTLAKPDKSASAPKQMVSSWALEGIRCHDGHPLRVPLEMMSSWVTNREE